MLNRVRRSMKASNDGGRELEEKAKRLQRIVVGSGMSMLRDGAEKEERGMERDVFEELARFMQKIMLNAGVSVLVLTPDEMVRVPGEMRNAECEMRNGERSAECGARMMGKGVG